jgi:hypothetical protein
VVNCIVSSWEMMRIMAYICFSAIPGLVWRGKSLWTLLGPLQAVEPLSSSRHWRCDLLADFYSPLVYLSNPVCLLFLCFFV